MNIDVKVDVALIHSPVVNRKGNTIGSAVTNLDLHDIARASKTYGVNNYWVVTPYKEQQELVKEIIGHWTDGHGAKAETDRASALSLLKISPDLEDMLGQVTKLYGEKPLVLATCAKKISRSVGYSEVKKKIQQGTPILLLFGTAWGLAPEAMAMADEILSPIQGATSFNHLSVPFSSLDHSR